MGDERRIQPGYGLSGTKPVEKEDRDCLHQLNAFDNNGLCCVNATVVTNRDCDAQYHRGH